MSNSFKVIDGGFGRGGGPEDPMLMKRVERLEEDVREIRKDVSDIKERLARMEGGFAAIHAKLDALPTVWTFVVALIGAVLASGALTAGIVALFIGTLR
jgi:hypothetical protein